MKKKQHLPTAQHGCFERRKKIYNVICYKDVYFPLKLYTEFFGSEGSDFHSDTLHFKVSKKIKVQFNLYLQHINVHDFYKTNSNILVF